MGFRLGGLPMSKDGEVLRADGSAIAGLYTGVLPDLAFATDEIPLPAYNIQLLDASSALVAPTTFDLIGNDIPAPTPIDAGGTHADAMFFDGIPVGTLQIIVTGNPTRRTSLATASGTSRGSWRSARSATGRSLTEGSVILPDRRAEVRWR